MPSTVDIGLHQDFQAGSVSLPGSAMRQNLRVSLGAVVLALATLAAMIFAWLNFVQRETFDTPDDGVAWLDTTNGAQAWKLAPNSPAAQAGVRSGDLLIAINNVPVRSEERRVGKECRSRWSPYH